MRRPVADRHVARASPSKAALRRQADELGLGDRRVALDRLEQPASGSASWSSTLHETCATPPRAASVRPIARRPGSPSAPPSRMARAIAPRVVGGRRRAELEVEGDQRRARGDERPRRRSGACARGRSRAAGRRPSAARGRRRRRGAARRACARRRARRRGRRAGRARRGRRRARAPRRSAAPRCSARRGRRPARRRARRRAGAGPAWRREVDALDRLARAARRAPRAAVPGSPASVKTARWWSGSAWRSSTRAPPAANAAPMASSDRGVAALGDVGDGEEHAQST